MVVYAPHIGIFGKSPHVIVMTEKNPNANAEIAENPKANTFLSFI